MGENSNQIHIAIEEAQKIVAQKGVDGADLKYVVLAGFGHMTENFQKSQKGVIHIKLDGKRLLALGILVGGMVIGFFKSVAGLFH
ncbi:hypothetical protein LCGC14_0782020 [marine sediment metagenome]|uniref:Uncharacterized protein n=1 Tax=marine sediment metagenome TaxID=412755 RepID=A0A0F9QF13_9ZZZZ